MKVTYGSKVRYKADGKTYLVRDVWKFANSLLVTTAPDTEWVFDDGDVDFWDEAFQFEIWDEGWHAITEIHNEESWDEDAEKAQERMESLAQMRKQCQKEWVPSWQ